MNVLTCCNFLRWIEWGHLMVRSLNPGRIQNCGTSRLSRSRTGKPMEWNVVRLPFNRPPFWRTFQSTSLVGYWSTVVRNIELTQRWQKWLRSEYESLFYSTSKITISFICNGVVGVYGDLPITRTVLWLPKWCKTICEPCRITDSNNVNTKSTTQTVKCTVLNILLY